MLVLQAAGPAEGLAGLAGGVAGSGLRAEGRAECRPAGSDSAGGGAEHPEGNQSELGPQQRSAHQSVPGKMIQVSTLTEMWPYPADARMCFITNSRSGNTRCSVSLWKRSK